MAAGGKASFFWNKKQSVLLSAESELFSCLAFQVFAVVKSSKLENQSQTSLFLTQCKLTRATTIPCTIHISAQKDLCLIPTAVPSCDNCLLLPKRTRCVLDHLPTVETSL